MSEPASGTADDFTIERHDDIIVVTPSPALEHMDPTLIEQAADVVLTPIRDEVLPLVVIDLSRVEFFGSSFLALLLRCWKKTQGKSGLMVLAGPSPRARELLRVTSLDLVWPIYATRREAIESLSAD